MILITSELLKYPPLDALLIIANESLNTSLNPGNCTIASIAKITGTLTECTVAGKSPAADNCANSYENQVVFVYNRIALPTIFGDVLNQPGSLPTTVKNITEQITKHTGIVFDEHDFEDRIINELPITLTPMPESRRWTGSLTIALTA